MEGYAFFTEAIFLALYIYGEKRLSRRALFLCTIPLAGAAALSAVFVISANAWMNTPQGFEVGSDGRITDVSVSEVLFNPAFGHEFVHMWLAAYLVTGFLVASVYAVGMLKGRRDRYHRIGFLIPFCVAAALTPVQIFVGDIAAREVAENQEAKFAAFECVYETGPDQAEHLGGICTDDEVKGSISIPGLNSFLVGWSTDTVVTGLDEIPDDEEPPAKTMLHWAFDVMVGIGFGLLTLSAWFAITWWRKRDLPRSVWFLRAAAIAGVAAAVALESGWVVTEVGRQPWIVRGFQRTSEAVTQAEGLWWVFALTMTLYLTLAVVTVFLLRLFARRWREGEAEPTVGEGPYGAGTQATERTP